MRRLSSIYVVAATAAMFFLAGCDAAPKQGAPGTVVTDMEAPVLTVQGNDSVSTLQNRTYQDAGATAIDAIDGDIAVQTSGSVDTSIPGEYTLTYTAVDRAGNSVSKTRKVVVVDESIAHDFSEAALIYNVHPRLDMPLTLSVENSASASMLGNSDFSWKLVTQPDTADLNLSVAANGRSALLTPNVPGDYIVEVSNPGGNSITTHFHVMSLFSFDPSNLHNYDPSTPVPEMAGLITDQAWVRSSTLDRTQVESVVTTIDGLNLHGYDETLGVLIDFSIADSNYTRKLTQLRYAAGIDSVNLRLYEGAETIKHAEATPDDGSAYDDGGDNWHLEYINAPEAWDVTTGQAAFHIGLSDGQGSFQTRHVDLIGRFDEAIRTDDDALLTHGTAAAGAIGAIADNQTGITGINPTTPMIGAKAGYAGLHHLINKESVLLSNNAWAIPGYLKSSFDPTVLSQVNARDNVALGMTRSYRSLAASHPRKLHVWSAGNGIGNGVGMQLDNALFYGVNGRLHTPAIHYNDLGAIDKAPNVMTVAAVTQNDHLVYYSNYGISVDIAAPTNFKSTKNDTSNATSYWESTAYDGNRFGSGYSGTSAAASVVTGVASLIYSIDPTFEASDVKSILIQSAKRHASGRYVTPGENSSIATISHTVPIVNAAGALSMAKAIHEGHIAKTYHSFDDPFKASATLHVTSASKQQTTQAFNFSLKTIESNATLNDLIDGDSLTSHTAVPLPKTSTRFNVSGVVQLKNEATGAETTPAFDYNFTVPNITVSVEDTVLLTSIADAGIEIQPIRYASTTTHTGQADANGAASLYLLPGSYKLIAKASGYKDYHTIVYVPPAITSLPIKVFMTPDSIDTVGAINGLVMDENGHLIDNATVRISGGEQTNGYFASSKTDASGSFFLSNISNLDSDGKQIESFSLSVTADDFAESIKKDVVILNGNSTTHIILMRKKNYIDVPIYTNDFESSSADWNATGFWHDQEMNGTLANILVDANFTSLPPDENTDRAYLPVPENGKIVMWYGQEGNGTFIGTQLPGDDPKSGGTSTTANKGTLTSPIITLDEDNRPILSFKSWWEIESVNPNSNGFDLLDIMIAVDGGSFSSIKRLNPFLDPNDPDRSHKGFSSGGFNRKPVWVHEEIDLSEYKGKNVQIQFAFDTVDGLYNGFRGWIIDDFAIVSRVIQSATSFSPQHTISVTSDTLSNQNQLHYNAKQPKEVAPIVAHTR